MTGDRRRLLGYTGSGIDKTDRQMNPGMQEATTTQQTVDMT